MAVDSAADFLVNDLLEKLKLDDPWVPPRSWDSLCFQGCASSDAPLNLSLNESTAPVVSESGLVRLSLNALQGVETALISIEKLSIVLGNTTADRTRHRIPSFWTRCSSTSAVGNLLSSLGTFGCTVFLLRRFVDYFTFKDLGGGVKVEENPGVNFCEESNRSLVNLAFAIAVGKVVDGYISALNTLYASVRLRRSLKAKDGGCLSSIEHSEITLMEVHNHTVGLRAQIEALGNLCNVSHLTLEYPVSSLEELRIRAYMEFSVFPRSGALLSFLYAHLKVADPDHCSVLKFLFFQSYEPYCNFIRSWIYDGSISDPYCEFVVESVYEPQIHASNDTEIPSCSPFPSVRIRDGVIVPCFLEECLVPLCRSGQQLQMIMKLLELCNNVGTFGAHEAILPCLDDLCRKYPGFASPLTFDKGTIETLSDVRSNYYERLLEKTEGSLATFDFISHQATSRRPTNALGKSLVNQASVVHESLIPSLTVTDEMNARMADNPETSSTSGEDSYAIDDLESSDCSSAEFSEDENDAEQLIYKLDSVVPCYLSALDFSSSSSYENLTKNLKQSRVSCSAELIASDLKERCGHAANSSRLETNLVGSKQKLSQPLETVVTSSEHNLCLFEDALFCRRKNENWLLPCNRDLELSIQTRVLPEVSLHPLTNVSAMKAGCSDLFPDATCASSITSRLHSATLKYDSTCFSTNPALNKGSFFDMRTTLRKKYHTNHFGSNFDFNSVEDPLKSSSVKLDMFKFGTTPSVITEAVGIGIDDGNLVGIKYYDGAIAEDVRNCCDGSPSHMKGIDEERLSFPNISGGSSWESLLGWSGSSIHKSPGDIGGLVPGAGMPPDIVIKRWLWDEILLQYKYVSKLAIKLLIEGFKLQEHFQALQSYHFMEVADWADLFIMSLWRHKWVVNEVDKRIPEIQGILEMALQRSSRQGDSNKDRLYVYPKKDTITYLSSFTGISSFDFMGLGYQIEWPVNIILTPDALQIYSDIFNFLMKVKLAVFSLSDTWRTLKGCRSKQDIGEVHEFSILTETRHKINHFVSALQQYIQSQLSQVSWLKFLQSLKHKVKDMLDLESVHMAYLAESLHICFLSSETENIAAIIQKILQCAMDFQCCLMLNAGSNVENLSQSFSQMNFSQVYSIRRTFHKSLTELHSIYLHSSKQSESGISHFWDYLDYNAYHTGVMTKQKGTSIFS